MKQQWIIGGALLVCGGFQSVLASEVAPYVSDLYHQWAKVRYQIPEDKREEASKSLKEQADELLKAHSDDVNMWIWHGIVSSSYAGAKGGLGALSLVKEAKADFEKAQKMDGSAFNGSAYTSLGALYYQVPGWPIGFGDDDLARKMLLKGLSYNPDGIDANFFYADFLFDQHEYTEAKLYLERALAAAPRADRPVADVGRREEIAELQKKVTKKLK